MALQLNDKFLISSCFILTIWKFSFDDRLQETSVRIGRRFVAWM